MTSSLRQSYCLFPELVFRLVAGTGSKTYSSDNTPGCRRGFFRNTYDTSLPLQMTVYTNGVSVLMPGYQVPTFIAHRAPVPCPPERMPWPPHQNVPPSPHFISGPS
ncbi:hypothetical protein MLD38_036987 [Melastoma candidum]|uniref:Uncharacterized protein n=1 Tax=Melastoma candidum TaxID=119954 RepID=A0ACB9LMD3_9MYRT|nr:hypothetical protein MLD38_036987 [Melastoma candidum]